MNLKNSFKYGALLVVLIIIALFALTGELDGFQISIDDKPVSFNDDMGYPYLTEQNRTMVPLRIISENMGYDVTWNQATKTATIKNGNNTVDVTIGKNVAIKNGQQVYMDIQNGKPVETEAALINSRTYVPIRFVSEAMGGEVGYNRLEQSQKVIHQIFITTGAVVPPVPTPGTDPTFDPVADVRDDGRLTKEKTTEYIEEMIEGTTLRKVDGKYILEFERPAIAEGFETGMRLDVKRHTALGYSLTTDKAYFDYNQLPGNQSFTKELDPERLKDVNFYKFTFSVYKPGAGASTSYEVWYWPESGKSDYIYTNEFGAESQFINFNKNRLFEGL